MEKRMEQNNNQTKAAFMLGYNAIRDRLRPQECEGNIIRIESFQDDSKKRVRNA